MSEETRVPCSGPAIPQTAHYSDPSDPETWCPECAPTHEVTRDTDRKCGAQCVYRWEHGHAADIRVCERTEGPCPHPPAARAAFSTFDRGKGERVYSDPCAAESEDGEVPEPEASDG